MIMMMSRRWRMAAPSQDNPDPKDSPNCPTAGTSGWRPVLARFLGQRPGFRPAHSKPAALRGLDSRRRNASCIRLVSPGSDSVVPRDLNHGGPDSPEDSSSGYSASSNSDMALYLAMPDGRPSSTRFATAVAVASALVVPFALDPKRAKLHQRTQRVRILSWDCGLRFQEAGLHQQTFQLLCVRCWSCHVLWTEKGPSPPSDTSRLCGCCNVGTARVFLSEPRRPTCTGGHCDFGHCRGPVLSDNRRPSFTNINRLCYCCGGVLGRVFISRLGRPSFT